MSVTSDRGGFRSRTRGQETPSRRRENTENQVSQGRDTRYSRDNQRDNRYHKEESRKFSGHQRETESSSRSSSSSRYDRDSSWHTERSSQRNSRDTFSREKNSSSRDRSENRNTRSYSGRRSRGPAAQDPAREAALETLRLVREDDAYGNLALSKVLRNMELSGRDAAFATEITYGTLRAKGILDSVISLASERSIDSIDGELLDILYMGAYQVLFMDVADHAAVATSVDLARQSVGQGRSGFINAVLRTITRRSREEWLDSIAKTKNGTTDTIATIATQYMHPQWIVRAFANALGLVLPEGDSSTERELQDMDELIRALEGDNARPIVHLTARPGILTASELADKAQGIVGHYSPHAVYMNQGGNPGLIDDVRAHRAWVQDEGSQLIVEALVQAPLIGTDSGQWLDLCAGPGGKAALLGAYAHLTNAEVTAVEPVPHRAEMVRKSTQGLPVEVIVSDGRSEKLHGEYDRILVDAPCSGLGSLRRRPEARWRHKSSDIGNLAQLQSELLAAAARLIRPGGVIVYSTCSPHLAETVTVVERSAHECGLEILNTPELVPQIDQLDSATSVQLWPHRHGTDAMFFAALRKPSAE